MKTPKEMPKQVQKKICMLCSKELNSGNAKALSPLCRICEARYATPRNMLCYWR